MEKRKAIALGIVLVLAIGASSIYFMVNRTGEPLDIKQDAKDIIHQYEEQKKIEEKIINAAESHEVDDLGYVHYHSHENSYNTPKGVVEYLFGTAVAGNIDLFSNAYDFATLAGDIEKEQTIEGKTKLLEEIIQRLTRNNTLIDVNYLGQNSNNEVTTVKVLLTYEDEKKVKLNIDLIALPDPHEGNTMYYVNTSSWDLIEKIEEK